MDTSDIFLGLFAIVLAAVIAGTNYLSLLRKKNVKSLWLAVLLRFFTAFFILLLILNPKYTKYNSYIEKPSLTVSMDNSSSISFLNLEKNAESLITRIKQSTRLKERFDISYYSFGDEVQSGATLSFTDNQTRINDFLTTVEKLNSRPGAMVIISDGNQTYGRDYSYQKMGLETNVYPVLLGDTLKIIDLKIGQINCNKYAFSGNSFPVEVFVSYEGDRPAESQLSIYSGNTKVFDQSINFSSGSETIIKNIVLQAKKPGTKVYRVQLEALDAEQNKTNNVKEFAIEVIDQRTEILLVSDLLHPDLGAIKKSIESNEQRRVTIAKSNVAQEEIDKSQLVILYQPTNAFRTLFQKINDQKRNYLIISGTQTDWNFLNRSQEYFQKEWIRQTEDIQAEKNDAYSVFNLEDVSFQEYPPLEGFLGELTFSLPAETLLYNKIRNITLESPLLATFEQDERKFGLLNGENIWKWRAHSFIQNQNFKDFDIFLGKLIFYLSSDKKRERLSVDYQPFYDGSTDLKITASYFNKNYEFDPDVMLLLTLINSESKESRKIPFVLKGGYFEADISTIPAGAYDFEVSVEDENFSKYGTIRILNFDIEKQFLTADVNRMLQLAETTGGTLVYADEFEKLENILMQDDRYKPIQKTKEEVVSLIDFRYLLFLIAALLSAEWFLRKYKGFI
ncbi:VWA domain-containing protein [Flavobacteriaceae bacterium M23B6Z8]